MEFFCRHCDEMIVGTPYRVISEENGVVLLNMTVCHACHEQAKALGLEAAPLHRDSRTGGATWTFGPAEA